jgi:hypothetical protein
MTEIDDKYASLGGPAGILGSPVDGEHVAPDGVGHFRYYQFGSIYWSPQTDAHEVHGLIFSKWAQLGWERSVLGYPTTDETDSAIAPGRYNLFQGGRILWQFDAQEAFALWGPIDGKYAQLGFEGGLLGFPITDVRPTGSDSDGRYSHFSGGSIYFKPSVGAHVIHGLIREYWAEAGWERSEFGYPINDESPLPVLTPSSDRYQDFENGVLYYHAADDTVAKIGPLAHLSHDDVYTSLDNAVRPLILGADPRIYLVSTLPFSTNPFLGTVTDYSVRPDGSVTNRKFPLVYSLGIHVDTWPDISVSLELWIEVNWAPAYHISAALRDPYYSVHVSVPFPTDIGQGPGEIVDTLARYLDQQKDVSHFVEELSVLPLSIKTQIDSTVDAFVRVSG